MSLYTRVSLALQLICSQDLLVDATCYYPDGGSVPVRENYEPCDTASGVDSACCASGDPCTNHGYCSGNAGLMYRGGCTDITWQSPNCCPVCRDSAIDSFSNMYPCPVNNGSFTAHNWCCGAPEGTEEAGAGCCQNTLFTLDPGNFVHPEAVFNTTDLKSSTLATFSSHISTSPSFISSPTSSILSEPTIITASTFTRTLATVGPPSVPAHTSQKSVAVGAGVGVPVGALSLFGLAFLFLRERRRRVHAQKMTNDAYTAAHERERERGNTTARDYVLRNHTLPQELESRQRGPNEIDSQEVHEANGGF